MELHKAIIAASNELRKAASGKALPCGVRVLCDAAVRSDGMDVIGEPRVKIEFGAMAGGKRGPSVEMVTGGQGKSIEFVGVANIDSFDDIDAAANEACEKLKQDWKESFAKRKGEIADADDNRDS